MALKNYYTKEEHEMQELVQKQIDLAGFGGEGFTEKQVNQIHEYAQMVGDELRVRSLIWNVAGANDRSDQERITQLMDDARKEVEIYPDRNVGMSALHGYGYFADDMYPLGKEKALDLHRRGLKVYCLQTDGSKSEYASREMIQDHEGLFGVERREWDALEADEPDYTEEFNSLRDPMIIVDKDEALKYYDAGATIYLITPFSQPIAAIERTEIERGSDYFQLPEAEQTLLKDLEAEMKNFANSITYPADFVVGAFIGNVFMVICKTGGIKDQMAMNMVLICMGCKHIFIFSFQNRISNFSADFVCKIGIGKLIGVKRNNHMPGKIVSFIHYIIFSHFCSHSKFQISSFGRASKGRDKQLIICLIRICNI